MQSQAIGLRTKGRMLGLVATMGALHAGHLALIRAARANCDTVIVSLYVNPSQFAPNEDFDHYPRQFQQDCDLCETEHVDIVFAPHDKEMYPSDFSTWVNEEKLSEGMCGASRPGHFRGVCTVVTKLFNVCRPDVAYFGQKDAQQTAIIKRMVRDLNFHIDIETVPTVRESDGLALSSRNSKLSVSQREEALNMYQSLLSAKHLVKEGVLQSTRIEEEVRNHLQGNKHMHIIYINLVDKDSLVPQLEINPGQTLLAIACWIDDIRLIDNLIL